MAKRLQLVQPTYKSECVMCGGSYMCRRKTCRTCGPRCRKRLSRLDPGDWRRRCYVSHHKIGSERYRRRRRGADARAERCNQLGPGDLSQGIGPEAVEAAASVLGLPAIREWAFSAGRLEHLLRVYGGPRPDRQALARIRDAWSILCGGYGWQRGYG